MKILHLSYSLASGGAERFVVDLCNELAKSSENKVTLVTLVDDNLPGNAHYLPELNDTVEYVCLKAKSGLSLKAIWRLFSFIIERKPDVVHAHCAALLLFLPSIIYRKCKYIHTLHNIAQKNIPFAWMRGIYRCFYRSLVQPVTISGACDTSYIQYYGLTNSICIYNGRSPIVPSLLANIVKEEVESYNNGNECPVFIHVARYGEAKNQQLLINVFEKLADEGKRFLLLILGNRHEHAPYYNKIRSSQIRILGEKYNVGDYLICSDYFVLSSLWEGLPISLLEAMSVGCVPVCTPAGGVADVVKHGTNGFLPPDFSEDSFYRLLNSCLLSHSKEALSVAARKDYADAFSMESCAKRYYDVYEL